MPPRRPLPDLCLISVFKALKPNDQLKASLMSLRCAILVRAANRRIKTLIITAGRADASLSTLKFNIDIFSLASKPSMMTLVDMPGELVPDDYPTTARLSRWNILQMSTTIQQPDTATTATINQIVTIFSAVNHLKFMTSFSEHYESLVSLIQHPNWQCQLTSLMVNGTYRMDIHLASRVVTAINSLTALQYLALDWDNDNQIPDLTILSQLKVCAFQTYSSHAQGAFLRSLERNAIDNEGLQVHLCSLPYDTTSLFTLSQPLRSRIVRCDRYWPGLHCVLVPRLCTQFRSLTSLSFRSMGPTEPSSVRQLFANLSQLQQLVYLEIELSLSQQGEPLPPQLRPQAQLSSLRALDLTLCISSHSQLEWLNLPRTMPHLKTIYIERFSCGSCDFWFGWYFPNEPSFFSSWLSSKVSLGCRPSCIFNLYPGIPLKHLTLHLGQECISAEKFQLMLNQIQSPPPPPVSTD